MMLLLYAIALVIGFVMLLKGADIFVDGSCALAKQFKVSGLIIGLTVVALGTSAPELAVSTVAAIDGSNEIALSNVIGSNIFNLLVVLGICAMIHPLPVGNDVRRRDFPVSILASIFVLVFCGGGLFVSKEHDTLTMDDIGGSVNRICGIILLVLFLGYIGYLIYDARKNPEISVDDNAMPLVKIIFLIIVGLILIIVGGKTVVYSAQNIARIMGLSETLIGLTIIAIGTSLPELMTSIVAARKGETELAVGNAVGSNIFNLMFILGISTIIHPISVNVASLFDLLILIVISILTWIFAYSNNKIARFEGFIMVLCYAADVVFAIMR